MYADLKQNVANHLQNVPAESLPYPVDMTSLIHLEHISLDAQGVALSSQAGLSVYDPATIVRAALAYWNQFCATQQEHYRQHFLSQARWLADQQQRVGKVAGGWSVSRLAAAAEKDGASLSASVQGQALSVLVRAYRLTGEEGFLQSAARALEPLRRDIFEGGVSAPLGESGVFFQDEATYPATHAFTGCAFALLGLYEYLAVVDDTTAAQLVERCWQALRPALDEFDTGFWTRPALTSRQLATSAQLFLQAKLLALLAGYSGWQDIAERARRWEMYPRRPLSRLRCWLNRRLAWFPDALASKAQRKKRSLSDADAQTTRVAISVYGFPSLGGTRAVLAGLAQVTSDIWHIEYITQEVIPHTEPFIIHKFGTKHMEPWQFPAVWLYVLTGWYKTRALLRRGAGYTVILPQDGVYSAFFSALAARLAGVRVVCIDHGNLTLLYNRPYRRERVKALETKNWSRPRILFARVRYVAYWPSLRLMARVAARLVDHYLVPGIAGDGVEEDCRRVGIPRSRLSRFASMIDIGQHIVPTEEERARQRAEKGLAADAMVVAIICRLSAEKGLEVALEGLSVALATLAPEQRARMQVVIAGDGPLRSYLETEIARRGLSENCAFWGELSHDAVLSLLGITDIFLYTSTRGACFSMAVLEAMASSCAVIATTAPLSNQRLLDEGRGIAVPVGASEQIGVALARLVSDRELCEQMGRQARAYIAREHSPAMFRRTLLRTTGWPAQAKLVDQDSVTESSLPERKS
jgi:glycosyltransferase involved in cell wall biosynthesis